MTLTDNETQPLLPAPVEDDILEDDFDPNGDVDNPREWPGSFKWALTLVLTFLAFSVYVPAHGVVLQD